MQTVQIPNSCGNICSLVLAGRFKGIAVGIPPISRSPLLLHSVVLAVPDLPKAPLVILTTGAFVLVAWAEASLQPLQEPFFN